MQQEKCSIATCKQYLIYVLFMYLLINTITEEDSSSLQSTDHNPIQLPAFDWTGVIDKVIERTSGNHEKTIKAISQNPNTKQEQMSKITDILSGLSALIVQQKQVEVRAHNTPSGAGVIQPEITTGHHTQDTVAPGRLTESQNTPNTGVGLGDRIRDHGTKLKGAQNNDLHKHLMKFLFSREINNHYQDYYAAETWKRIFVSANLHLQ